MSDETYYEIPLLRDEVLILTAHHRRLAAELGDDGAVAEAARLLDRVHEVEMEFSMQEKFAAPVRRLGRR